MQPLLRTTLVLLFLLSTSAACRTTPRLDSRLQGAERVGSDASGAEAIGVDQQEECESLKGLAVPDALRVLWCREHDPESFAPERDGRNEKRCSLGSHEFESQQIEGRFDFEIMVTADDGTTARLSPTPTANVFMKNVFIGIAPSACDVEAQRYFYANTLLGYVVAYSRNGRELWRLQLPDFRSADEWTALQEQGRDALFKAFAEGPMVLKVSSSGPYVAIAHRKGLWETYQTVVHRSGVVVAQLGPWDGLMIGSDDEGFEILAGGFKNFGDIYSAPEKLKVSVANHEADDLVEHFLAWNFPLMRDKEYVWRSCVGVLPETIRHWLGTRYDKNVALRAREAKTELGQSWFERLSEDSSLMEAIANVRARDRDSIEQLRKSLLVAGADTDLARLHYGEVSIGK